ncbi:MAG: AbrB/MazE/SpoVT family DNA-binding domain-containing protein [Chlorobium sp.]|nr:MAG: AbrB/MazE/SpoVT family DNA-binding domain-containing protein [Chlorobium sp.]
MLTKVQKWGNSLALRIPKTYALEAKLENDSDVDISMVEGQLVIRPIVTINPDLAHLLSGITENNLHNEFDTGEVVGNENW